MSEITFPEFKEFEKIPRLKRACVITEKIDGTNASIFIHEDGQTLETTSGRVLPFLCGSRTRWIFPENDNYGFARWAYDHAEELLKLGPGHHFGEWWGSGVQRGYGLKNGEKRFSLFNVGRWIAHEPQRTSEKQSVAPPCCSVVPVLWSGQFSTSAVEEALREMREHGSVASPGFMNPEGVVVYLAAARALFKVTLEKDEEPKSKAS
jgi:hypothetical protein